MLKEIFRWKPNIFLRFPCCARKSSFCWLVGWWLPQIKLRHHTTTVSDMRCFGEIPPIKPNSAWGPDYLAQATWGKCDFMSSKKLLSLVLGKHSDSEAHLVGPQKHISRIAFTLKVIAISPCNLWLKAVKVFVTATWSDCTDCKWLRCHG